MSSVLFPWPFLSIYSCPLKYGKIAYSCLPFLDFVFAVFKILLTAFIVTVFFFFFSRYLFLLCTYNPYFHQYNELWIPLKGNFRKYLFSCSLQWQSHWKMFVLMLQGTCLLLDCGILFLWPLVILRDLSETCACTKGSWDGFLYK